MKGGMGVGAAACVSEVQEPGTTHGLRNKSLKSFDRYVAFVLSFLLLIRHARSSLSSPSLALSSTRNLTCPSLSPLSKL